MGGSFQQRQRKLHLVRKLVVSSVVEQPVVVVVAYLVVVAFVVVVAYLALVLACLVVVVAYLVVVPFAVVVDHLGIVVFVGCYMVFCFVVLLGCSFFCHLLVYG